VCGSGIPATTSRAFPNDSVTMYSRKTLRIVRGNAGSIHVNNLAPSLASELHQQKEEANHTTFKKGTLFDDES
jgi:hypothetical protein